MLVFKRRPGEVVEITSYGVDVKVVRVNDSQSVWILIDRLPFGPLREGEKIKIKDVILCVVGFMGRKVKLGFDGPRDIVIDRKEVAEAKRKAGAA